MLLLTNHPGGSAPAEMLFRGRQRAATFRKRDKASPPSLGTLPPGFPPSPAGRDAAQPAFAGTFSVPGHSPQGDPPRPAKATSSVHTFLIVYPALSPTCSVSAHLDPRIQPPSGACSAPRLWLHDPHAQRLQPGQPHGASFCPAPICRDHVSTQNLVLSPLSDHLISARPISSERLPQAPSSRGFVPLLLVLLIRKCAVGSFTAFWAVALLTPQQA